MNKQCKQPSYFLFFFFFLAYFPMVSGGDMDTACIEARILTREGDIAALKALYQATDGDSWRISWDLDGDPYGWAGVTWENDRVIELSLPFNDLTGSIPPEMGNLTSLVKLDLSSSSFSGSIPPVIWELTNLEWLNLRKNDFSGSIPSEVGNLPRLKRLDLSWNDLSGSIPPEIGNLTSLEALILRQNDLSGSVPAQIGNLKELVELSLQINQLSGLPIEMENLSKLSELSIQFNKLDFSSLESLWSFGSSLSTFSISPQGDIAVDEPQISLITGQPITLSVDAPGQNNRYQWFFNSSPISGISTSPDYIIASAKESDEGIYYCQVTNTTVTSLTMRTEDIAVFKHPVKFSSDPIIVGGKALSMTLESTVNTDGTIYYLALPEGSMTPFISRIIDGEDALGRPVSNAGSIAVVEGVKAEFTIRSLSPSTAYDVYVLAISDNIWNNSMELLSGVTAGGIEFANDYPKLTAVGGNSAKLSIHTTREGVLHHVVLPEGSTSPSAAQVIAGTDADGSMIALSGSTSVRGGIEEEVQIGGLDIGTMYDIYLTAEDEEGLTTEVARLDVETTITSIGDEILRVEKVQVYPNPVGEILHVEVDAVREYDMELTGLKGERVLEQRAMTGTTMLDMRLLDRGVYLLHVRMRDKSAWMRLVKQ